MKLTLPFALLLFGVVGTAAAEDTSRAREDVKKDLLLPECSWSKMNKEQYNECQKQRSTLKVMTPAERAKYLEHTEQGSVTVSERGGLVRNKIISNRPAGGGGRN